jgi:ABC-2 type transport system ATP-binding protein
MSEGPAVAIDGLSKSFNVGFLRRRRRPALVNLSLQVERGEIFGYLGPNGSGKTTTLKLLVGLLHADAGTARILGLPLRGRDWRQRVGFLPENPYLYDYLTAREYLEYVGQLFGLPAPERRRRAGDLLEKVGMAPAADWPMRRYSKGMLQRVGLAQALVNQPELVFLDEPMSGLDPLGRRDVRALILRLRDEGRTVFFSSHILSDAETLCSRIAIVAKGKLMAAGSLTDLVTAQLKGWEVVVDGLAQPPSVQGSIRTVTPLAPGRYVVEALPTEDPLRLARELTGAGGRLISITQLHDTLEDLFVRQVDQASGTDRFALPLAAGGER